MYLESSAGSTAEYLKSLCVGVVAVAAGGPFAVGSWPLSGTVTFAAWDVLEIGRVPRTQEC